MKQKRGWRDRDWMDTGVTILIFVIPAAILVASIAASFNHIKDWAVDHSPAGTHQWLGWAFACIVELIPIFGVLVMWKLRKAHHDLTVPRVLLGTGFILSMSGQVAYAGGLDAGLSRLIVAAGPSIAGLALTEVLLWLVRVVIEGPAAVKVTTAPSYVPPPPGMIHVPPVTTVSTPVLTPVSTPQSAPMSTPGHGPVSAPGQVPVSPWSTPPVGRDVPPVTDSPSRGGQMDNVQVITDVPPADDPVDTEDEPAIDLPLVNPDVLGDKAPSVQEDSGPDDQEGTDPGVQGDMKLDPRAMPALQMREAGKTKKEVADHFRVSDKTIQRLWREAESATEKASGPLNGKTPHLVGE